MNQGFNTIYQTKTILAKLCVSCHSKTEGVQRRAIEAIIGLLTPVKKYLDASKKGKTANLEKVNEEGRHIEHLVIYVGKPNLLNSYIDLSDLSHMKESMVYIIDNLLMPFVEVELQFLRLMTSTSI